MITYVLIIVAELVVLIIASIGWWKEAALVEYISEVNERIKDDLRNAQEEKRILLLQLSGIVETQSKITHE